MSEFTQNITSPFPNQNILFNSASGITGQQIQQNQLAIQEGQQKVGATDMDMVGRAATQLLNMPEDQAAAAYPGMIHSLQAQGFAKNAPPTYPGHAAVQGLVNQAMTVPQQYSSGIIMPPGLADTLQRITGTQPTGTTGAPGAATGGAPANFNSALATSESGGNPNVINKQGYTGLYQFGKQRLADLGYYTPAPGEDMNDNTKWAGKVSVPGFNVTDQASFAANPAAQQAVFNSHLGDIDKAIDQMPNAANFDRNGLRAVAHLGGISGMERFAASGGLYNPSDANGTRLSAYYQRFAGGSPGQGGTGTTTAAVQTPGGATVAATQPVPGAPGGVAARTGGTDTAGPGAGPAATPGATAAAPAATPASVPVAQNGLAPPAPQRPQVAPASPAAAPPAAATPPATGVNSPQFQQALQLQNQALQLETMYPTSPQAKAAAAALRQRAQLIMQADSVSVDPNTGIQTKAITGEQVGAAAPRANYQWDAQQGAYVDTTGTHPPVTPPSPRLTQTKGGDVLQSKPGGGATVVYSTSPQDVATQAAAQSQGSGTGQDVAKQLPALIAQARIAAQQEGQIDYATNQLREAAKGGIPSGYFADGLATAAAAAKSLGIDTSSLGVNPQAVGNVQTAQKTLAVIGGAILQQAIGKDSQITNDKIEAFIHTQPGIQNDPQALQRIMAWARSQYTYEREMGQAAVGEAANSPTGTLPLNWQAKYFRDHGFAPVYEPTLGEMQQPDGRQPARETPPPVVNIPSAAVEHLKQNPNLSGAFDQKYGPGASKRALGQ